MRHDYKKILIILVWAACIISSPFLLYAQDKDDDFRDKIENIKLDKMVKKMGLDDATSSVFKDKYKTFSKSMRQLNTLRAKAYKEMTENIENGNGIDTLVTQVLNYESEINQKRMDFVTDLKSTLTLKQIAIMIVFERRFNAQLKKMLQNLKDNTNN